MIYTKDDAKIRDAKKEVEDAKLEIQKNDIQKQIDALDDEIEKYNELIDAINDQIDAINDQIDAVNDQIDTVNDYIDGLNDIVDQINDAADAQVDALEKTKNKWQEVIDQQEEAQNMLLLTGEFGADAIRKILTGNDDDLLTRWKDSYITTLSEIDSETQGYIGDMTDQLAGLYNVDLTPLQAQFDNVKESVNGVNNSIGGDEGSLTDAFTQVGNTANEVIGAPDAEGDGTVIGELGSMKTAVNDVSDALSAGEDSLENAILDEAETAIDAFNQHTEKITNEVIPAIQSATNEMNTFNETADRDIEKTITIRYQTVGSPDSNIATGKAHAEGTANVQGNAFANGSDGLKYHEKNALRSEYGQPELTVYPDGNYEITDTPTISDLPKGTVIYNEEQTKKIMSEKPKVSGNAHADGTVDDKSIVLSDGQILIRVPDDSPLLEMRRKADAYIEKFGGTLEDILKPVNAIQHHFDEIEKIVDNSIHNNIVNNNNNQPSVSFGDINITCPGVRDPEVARNLYRIVEDIFDGLPINGYQKVMRTR